MSENHTESGVFHTRDATDFFYLLENALKRYDSTPTKSIALFLFLIMGLNHLRDCPLVLR